MTGVHAGPGPDAASGLQLVVVLGSNADPRIRMQQAREELGQVVKILAASEEIEAPSYLSGDPRSYRNQALLLEWAGEPGEFSTLVRGIEHRLGRSRSGEGRAGADVAIDIDLVAAFTADDRLCHVVTSKLEPTLLRSLVYQVLPEAGQAQLDAALQ